MTVISLNSTPVGWARLKVLAAHIHQKKDFCLWPACLKNHILEVPFNTLRCNCIYRPNLMYYTPSLAMLQLSTIQRHFLQQQPFWHEIFRQLQVFPMIITGSPFSACQSVSLSTGKSSDSLDQTLSHCHRINLPLFHGNMAAVGEGGGKVFCSGALPWHVFLLINLHSYRLCTVRCLMGQAEFVEL